jgi:IS5 family transposase
LVLAIWAAMAEDCGMQGRSDRNAELLDAAALCRHLVPEGSVAAFLADHRRELFPDEMFADLFLSGRGRPSVPADVVATVMVLQALEGLSDRDAAMALRTNIAWKVAAGLALDAEGIHYTVLTYWRTRLRASEAPDRIAGAVRSVLEATGVLSTRRRRALDSTLLDDAVATQDTVTQMVSAIRRVRRLVPQAATVEVTAHDYDASGKPVCAWDDPEAKTALVTGLVNDARAIIVALDGVDLDEVQADAVGLLALVAGQDVEPGDSDGTWRIARRVAPDRVISTVDPDSRHMHKSRSVYRDGYKAHVSVEPDTGLITATALTPANAGDGPTGIELLDGEEPGLQVLADSAYGSGQVRAELADAGHTPAIKAIPLRRNPKLGPDQLNRDHFRIDHTARTVTCPGGHTVPISPTGSATFGARCRGCPLRSRCTTAAEGRHLNIGPHDAELVAARAAWNDGDFAADYRHHRPMVERSLAWLVAKGNRRVPYRGLERNQHWLETRVAAINLRRLITLGLERTEHSWTLA